MLTRTLAPTAYPISLTQAKANCRVDSSDEDNLISSYIATAVNYCEKQTSCAFVGQTFRLDLDRFPEYGRISEHYCLDDVRERIILPIGPVQYVSSIAYKDSDGATQTWSSSEYQLVSSDSFACIECKPGYTFPARGVSSAAVTVTYRAGYLRPFTADASTDALTFASSQPADLEDIFLSTTDNDLPAPLAINTAYDTNGLPGLSCSIRAAGSGSDINITDAGTGTHFIGVLPEAATQAMLLLISFWYSTRNASVDIQGSTPQVQYLLSTLNWGAI